jgi:hypothetical protein
MRVFFTWPGPMGFRRGDYRGDSKVVTYSVIPDPEISDSGGTRGSR